MMGATVLHEVDEEEDDEDVNVEGMDNSDIMEGR